MRLKELEIQGFKSFPDKTRITIGEGITGVVGPNGSGKSNISDSIRWVLGETSSKQLRGAGKMEDVIFGGTQTRGAMGYAAVSLTIDNSDHGLEMDADEVTIGRRYYRSGESEYTINGQSVRLKDVYELLLDTGLGRDGYAIVGQGRIAEIVGAKSTERREIFEEASGIAKYRYRKNEAERRLAAAEGNLERLRDILGELEKRVGPLKRDSEKAEQFLSGYPEMTKKLASAAKAKRINEHTNPAYRWVALAIVLAGAAALLSYWYARFVMDPINKLAAAMVRRLCEMDQKLLSDKAAILDAYRKDCITLGQDIVLLRGEEKRYGKALDVDEDGALVVAFTDGTVGTVNSGEVSVRGMYGYV